MDQLSLPLRIALLATFALAGLWLLVLKPQAMGETEAAAPPSPAAAVAQPAKAAEPAEPAKAAEPGAKPAEPAKAARPAEPAATKPAKPKRRMEKSAAALARDLRQGRIAVLLFWNPRSSDDRAVREAVRRVDRRRGRATVHVASLEQIADYAPLLGDVPVAGSPTVLVIGRDRSARVITGLTVTGEIDQVVADTLKRR